MTDFVLLRTVSLLLVLVLYLVPVLMLAFGVRHVGGIKTIVEGLAKSPKDVSDIIMRFSGLILGYVVVTGVVVLKLAGVDIGGAMSYMLFAVVGWVFGALGPRPFKGGSEG